MSALLIAFDRQDHTDNNCADPFAEADEGTGEVTKQSQTNIHIRIQRESCAIVPARLQNLTPL